MTRIFQISIVTLVVLSSGCELPESTAVIDTRIPPTIIEASITPDNFDMGKVTSGGTTVDVTVKGYVNTTDDNGLDDISAVQYSVYSPAGKVIASGVLQDGGSFPDASANDGKYNSNITLSLPKDIIGKYTVQFASVDKDGYTSTTFNLPFSIIYSLNHPPTVNNFTVPDTVTVPSSGTSFIETIVRANDTEGLSDIASVSMSIVRPADSSIVAVYGLFDDGGKFNVPPFGITSGDSIAGDGYFTLLIPVPSTTFKNIERQFNVFATDQSGATSNLLSKKVYFK
jgi:hypothetical protein